MELTARNVNDAYAEGWWRLRAVGVAENSRNGPVLVAPGPVLTTYSRPCERVLFDARRDANPVFHLVETIWMFAGRNDVESLLPYNSGYAKYAEPNGHVHGAYGYRWRAHFNKDQLKEVVQELTRDPESRRAVIAMWDPEAEDMGQWKDTPCNTHIYFDLRGGALNMTVCCRSNDMLWGAYGANVVHFSMLQELLALELRAPVGVYRQFSNNFHVYTDLPLVKEMLAGGGVEHDPYSDGTVAPLPLLQTDGSMREFIEDCERFFLPVRKLAHSLFMINVVIPLAEAYLARKEGRRERHEECLAAAAECDWKTAYNEWWQRRPFPQPKELK